MSKGAAVVFLLLSMVMSGYAETITSAASGNWSQGSTWAVISRTGTITVTSGQADVTGSGTLFLSEITVGSILLRGDGTTLIGTVASVTDDTHLTLTANASSSYSGNYTARKVPASTDVVVIAAGTDVAQNVSATSCAGLTITGTLSMNNGDVCTVDGAVGGAGTWSNGGGGTKTIQLTGDYAFSGTSAGNGVVVILSGAGSQTLSGTISTGTGSLTINKSSGDVVLGGNVMVNGTLTLTQGNITTGSNTLTLGSAATKRGTLSRTSGTIIGKFARWFAAATVSSVLFPVGTAGNYRPATISFTAAPSAAGTITCSFLDSDPGDAGLPLNDAGTSILNCAGDGYWSLTATALTGGTYTLDLTADGFGGVSVVATLRILKRATGASWTLQGTHAAGTGTIATPIVHRTGMSGFSEFGVGGGSDNPLPVELVSFTAIATGQSTVELYWSTASETNNYGFEVQKCTEEDTSYRTIPGSFQAGQGTTVKETQYRYTDEFATPGNWLYRLKQIDLDGTTHYSAGIHVGVLADAGEVAPGRYALSQNYPNPFNPTTRIAFTIAHRQWATLKVWDVTGRAVATLLDEWREPGTYAVEFDASSLPSGVYFYRLQAGDFTQTKRLMVLK